MEAFLLIIVKQMPIKASNVSEQTSLKIVALPPRWPYILIHRSNSNWCQTNVDDSMTTNRIFVKTCFHSISALISMY